MPDAHDLLSSPWHAFLVFWLPAITIVIAGGSWVSTGWRTAVWSGALAVIGIACVVNALRCGRVHCYITGPFFLLMAAIALLYGLHLLPLGRHGWNVIGVTTLIGAIVLCCVPEMMVGKYRKGRLM
jgi:hypothetical protein